MHTVNRGGWMGAGLAVVVALGISFWWLAGDLTEATDSSAVVQAPSSHKAPGAEAALSTGASSALAERLEANPEAFEAPAEAPELKTATAASIQAAALVDLRIVGRLLDERGMTVAHAPVTLNPTKSARVPLGYPAYKWGEPTPWNLYPSTLSGDDGRFVISSQDIPHDLVVDGAGSRGRQGRPRFPGVLVAHPQFEQRLVECAGWTGGAVDLGDIALTPSVVLVGRVIDEQGRGLPNAEIALPHMAGPPNDRWENGWADLRDSLRVAAGEGGRFELGGLWRGRNDILITYPGKTTLEQNLDLETPGRHDAGDFVLITGGIIVGRVTDDQGQPFGAVEVLARPQTLSGIHGGEDTVLRDLRMRMFSTGQREERTMTDDDGNFVFDILPSVAFDVFVAALGREPVAEYGVTPGGSPLDMVLVKEAAILVTVVDAHTRNAVPGATGTARRRADREDAPGTTFSLDPSLDVLDGDEAAAAAGLDPGTPGLLWVKTAGWLRNEVSISAPGYGMRTLELPGVQAPDRLEQTVELIAAASLTGRMVDPAGEPLANVQARLTHKGSLGMASIDKQATSGPDGRFTFDDLYAEQWRLRISLPGRASPEPLALELVDEEKRDLGDLVLSTGGALQGVVVDPQGATQAGVTVTAVRLLDDGTDGEGITAVSDLAGAFRYVDLASGQYHLSCFPGAELKAEVASEQTTDVVLRTRRLPRLHGRVVRAGLPVEGATVSANQDVGFEDSQAVTNAQGEYELETKPGQIVVVARHGDHWTAAQTLDVHWDEVKLVDLSFSLGVISGVIRERSDMDDPDRAGVTIPAARVTLQLSSKIQRHGSDLRRRGTTDEAGRFRFEHLPPGPWAVHASEGDHVRSDAQVIPLGPDEIRDDIVVELQAGAVVVGTIVMAGEGPPWSSLNVSATSVDSKSSSNSARIDDDGSYRLRGLAPGTHRIQIMRNRSFPAPADADHIFAETTITVELGQEVRVDLTAVPLDL